MPGALVYLAEHNQTGYRGFYCGTVFFSINLGNLFASGLVALLYHQLSPMAMDAWGWRIPFLVGGILGIAAYFLRSRLYENSVFLAYKRQLSEKYVPIKEVFRHHVKQSAAALMLCANGAVIIMLLYIYMPTYLMTVWQYSSVSAHVLNSFNLLLLAFLVLLYGWLSDIIGRKKLLLAGALGLVFFSVYALQLLGQHYYFVLFLISLFAACVIAAYPIAVVESFDTSIRYSAVSLSYNLAFSLFGGTAPLICTYLIGTFHNKLIPAYYLIGINIIAFMIGILMRDRYKLPLFLTKT